MDLVVNLFEFGLAPVGVWLAPSSPRPLRSLVLHLIIGSSYLPTRDDSSGGAGEIQVSSGLSSSSGTGMPRAFNVCWLSPFRLLQKADHRPEQFPARGRLCVLRACTPQRCTSAMRCALDLSWIWRRGPSKTGSTEPTSSRPAWKRKPRTR
jgi:hypothetical protein